MNFQIGFALNGNFTNITHIAFYLEVKVSDMCGKGGSLAETFHALDANYIFFLPVYRLNMLAKIVIVTC